jgi:uncharacterized membrane protein YdbT with pleckstrin-like domain
VSRDHGVPGDLILEPEERVLVASRPLYLWEPLLALLAGLVAIALLAAARLDLAVATLAGLAAAVLGIALFAAWIPWQARWYVLTDRRVIARWGVINRNQAALLLDRVQDAWLRRPFPLSLVRDYGVVHIESAGEHSRDVISSGLRDLKMTRASAFYRALTDAMTPQD